MTSKSEDRIKTRGPLHLGHKITVSTRMNFCELLGDTGSEYFSKILILTGACSREETRDQGILTINIFLLTGQRFRRRHHVTVSPDSKLVV